LRWVQLKVPGLVEQCEPIDFSVITEQNPIVS